MISYSKVKKYLELEISDKVRTYRSEFFNSLKEYSRKSGHISRNGHRVYIPFTGHIRQIDININDGGSATIFDQFRAFLLGTESEIGELRRLNADQGRQTESIDYLAGTCTVSFKDGSSRRKTDIRKIGKILARNSVEFEGKPALDWYNADPIRLKKRLAASSDLMIAISDHPYDLAGMSTGRDWTSCMNIENGACREYVVADIRFGTLAAYLCEASDINIENPYARILIKPYKLQRSGYSGFDPAPIIYYPESTVYSAYAGLDELGAELEKICRDIQTGTGRLRPLGELYNDTWKVRRGIVIF